MTKSRHGIYSGHIHTHMYGSERFTLERYTVMMNRFSKRVCWIRRRRVNPKFTASSGVSLGAALFSPLHV